jgi:hypothetical protein
MYRDDAASIFVAGAGAVFAAGGQRGGAGEDVSGVAAGGGIAGFAVRLSSTYRTVFAES